MASSSAVRLGNDQTAEFRSLIAAAGPSALDSQRKWEKQRDESLGPILSASFVLQCKKREMLRDHGEGKPLSQKERDCLKLRKADEEWIREAARVVSRRCDHQGNPDVLHMIASIALSFL